METTPPGLMQSWSQLAFNQEPDSPNQIHGDELAQQFGFEGGLVPGVTVSAYLLHPAVEAWEEDFLDRGWSHVRVLSPLYDGETFAVEVGESGPGYYEAALTRPDGTLSARAEVRLPDTLPAPPERRGDPLVALDYVGPPATLEQWMQLRAGGCSAQRFEWRPGGRLGTYLRDETAMPALLRGPEACANPAFILGISNWIAAANAYMNPWVHLETRAQHFRCVQAGTAVVAEMSVTDLFEKRGHEFVDVQVDLYDEADDTCLASIALRAIYRLRGAD